MSGHFGGESGYWILVLDTIASNTGLENGACALVESSLGRQ